MVQRSIPEDKFFKEIDADTEYINAPGAEYAQLIAPEGSEPASYLTEREKWLGKEEPRFKFGMPDKTKVRNVKRRYDDIVEQMSLLMIKAGNKSQAESVSTRVSLEMRRRC